MRWRRGSKFILANSIVAGGQRAGLDIDDDSTASYYKAGISRFYNSILHSFGKPFQVDRLNSNPKILDSIGLANLTLGANYSVYFANAADVKLADPFNNATPNLKPLSGSPALTTTARFDLTGTLDDPFFEKVNYIGAFDGNNDWTASWTVWNK
jgi:hypothetical protein